MSHDEQIKIGLIVVDAPLESQSLRAAAESFGMSVAVSWVGNADQVVEFLSKPIGLDIIIIGGHGDERGLILPVFEEAIKANYR